MTDRLLITGATGFIGRALVASARQRGWAVRSTSRVCQDTDHDVCIERIDGRTDWQHALEGCSHVIHLAGYAHVVTGMQPDECWQVNVDGTRRLAEQAAAAGVRRFVYLSSAKVMGETSGTRVFTDNDPPQPDDDYARSKLAAENALGEITTAPEMHDNIMEHVILRPPLVYGPHVKGNLRALLAALSRGVPLPFGACRARRSLCGIDNLIDASLLCLTHPAAAGRCFLVGDTETLTVGDMMQRLNHDLGKPAHLVNLPDHWLNPLTRLPRLGPRLKKVLDPFEIDTRSIRQTLHWTPPRPAAEGLLAMAQWYQGPG